MAYMITDECINCHACIEECPTNSISEGDYYETSKINPELCTECVGVFDSPACLEICPVDAIVPDPDFVETKEALLEKSQKINAA